MHVGTFSGVRSPGMVISSALQGTSKGNSSLTNDKISDVFPTFLKKKNHFPTLEDNCRKATNIQKYGY